MEAVSAYRDHLASPAWAAIRSEAAERSGGLCEFCKEFAQETHHVKYPKGYANDNAGNVLHVCSVCHRKAHGMNPQKRDRRLELVPVKTFKDCTWTVEVDEAGWVWQSWDGWAGALVIPMRIRQRMEVLVVARANLFSSVDEPHVMYDEKGNRYFTWLAVGEGLHEWQIQVRSRRDARGQQIPLDEDERRVYGNIDKARQWGQRLQNDFFRGRLQGQRESAGVVVPMTNEARLALSLRQIGIVTQDHEQRLQGHEHRLVLIESAAVKDPSEGLTATDFAIEKGKDPGKSVSGEGGERLDQFLGRTCKHVLKASPLRFEYVRNNPYNREKEKRNVWRRADLQAAYELLPK